MPKSQTESESNTHAKTAGYENVSDGYLAGIQRLLRGCGDSPAWSLLDLRGESVASTEHFKLSLDQYFHRLEVTIGQILESSPTGLDRVRRGGIGSGNLEQVIGVLDEFQFNRSDQAGVLG